ncbi:hypothetical protein BKA80DRAFT_285889 [Phyllosticta citrichinensis]
MVDVGSGEMGLALWLAWLYQSASVPSSSPLLSFSTSTVRSPAQTTASCTALSSPLFLSRPPCCHVFLLLDV